MTHWSLMPSQIADIDQTPLRLCFIDGETYADIGDKTEWVRSGVSSLEKRQCTAQVTLFADRESRVKLLLIFKGKAKCISFREKLQGNIVKTIIMPYNF